MIALDSSGKVQKVTKSVSFLPNIDKSVYESEIYRHAHQQ